ncbi:7TM diverse intracellular signaling domain-containing protein [Hymenobacter sp. ASUV-10]|uniref:7TM diverse intracellular signaling domain-containing protein n=1 Tax=Hymenobacter aranciens TaxID=3063996 RepID=A0ABT9BHP9_9BACT|nr:7TM diverse intracellular signaling domain-containing protein [Hymenobacter sp. ASUV-10]MDO7877799.1 7TM diverse intracellular signaling domain-containing protein [Hymenobacter sp. ASUV-10]
MRQLLLFILLACPGLLRAAAASQPLPAPLRVAVLPDRGYSWARIRRDTTLTFALADSLHPARAGRYWLRLTLPNPSRYSADVQLLVRPALDNTLYYLDHDAGRWRSRRAGTAVPTDSQWTKGALPLRLPAAATSTCYVLVRLGPPAARPAAVRLRVQLAPAAQARQAEQFSLLAWLVALAVLGLLLLTNALAYLRRPDRPTAWYLCTQLGAALYLTAYRGTFKEWWPGPVFSQLLLPSGRSYAYTLNSALIHLSVMVVLLGLVQLTRSYLGTRARLPRLDAALRAGLAGYGLFTLAVGLVNLSGFYLDQYSLLFDNLLVLALLGLLLATAVVADRRRLPLARPYLLANVLPLLGVGLVAGYHVAVSVDNDGNLLPHLALVAHALSFSWALNIQLQYLQRALLSTERAAAALALDIQTQQLRHREIVLQNAHIQAALGRLQQQAQAREQHARQLSAEHELQQAANHELQQQLEANQRELASTSLYVQQKNALLAELRQQLQELGQQRPAGSKAPPELAGIKSLLQSNLYLDEDWSRFKLHFEQVHPRFFEELQNKYPALTSHEQRLYCYFHIQLSTKEIAALLNIDPASVRRAKTRLYKKIGAADAAAGRPTGPAPADDAPAAG